MEPDDYHDYQEMEERLYAQMHHDDQPRYEENERHFHVPRLAQNRSENRGRYWAPYEENYQARRSNQQFDKKHLPYNQQPGRGRSTQDRGRGNRQQQQQFDKGFDVPRHPQQKRNVTTGRHQNTAGGNMNRKQFEKRIQSNNFPLKTKGPITAVNPFNIANQEKVRLENKIRVMQKKKKALTRQQPTGSNFKIPQLPSTSRGSQGNQRSSNKGKGKGKKAAAAASPITPSKVIFIDSCSDSESLDGPPVKGEVVEVGKSEPVSDIDESFQDDDVIMIPTKAPEVVSLLDSDDDSSDEQEANKKPKVVKEPGSRCVSPSNSSILSDDFIGQSDRSRLQSEFLFVLPEDDDIQGTEADKNQSSASEDSTHSDDTSPIKDSQIARPSTVGDLGGFILPGAAVENSLNDSNTIAGHETETQKEHESDEEENESPTADNEVNRISPKRRHDNDDDDVILLPGTSTEQVRSSSRKRTSSHRSSDNDIVLNLSSNRNETAPSVSNDSLSATVQNVPVIEIDDDNDEESTKLDPEVGWNDEMKRYYYESWGGEHFNLKRILSDMCPDRKNWNIDVKDCFPPASVKMRNRCRNCQEFSHKVQNCPLPKRRIVCHMCGEEGHREPRCPNCLCLSCGAPQRQFMRYCRKCIDNRKKRCSLCGVRGHIFAMCPDKWRRYHNTIEDNVPLDETYVPNNAKWCSVCASSEHQAHNCLKAETEMGRSLPIVQIASYLPWYKLDVTKPKVTNPTEYSMMSFAKDFSFNWSSATTENYHGFYNRFKERTGLMQEEMERNVESELAQVRQQSKKKNVAVIDLEEGRESDVMLDESSDEHDPSEGLINFSFTKEMEKIKENQQEGFHLHLEENQQVINNVKPVVFEDQRRKIAEMAERFGVTEEDIMSVRRVEFPIESELKEMDFIPLESSHENERFNEPQPSSSNRISTMEVQEAKTDAKVFLTKEHSQFLLTEGDSFLYNASKKYDLQLHLVWESIGNVLQMYGLPSKQNTFYNELLEFLRDVTLEDHVRNRNNAFSMPKVKDKLIKFIEEHLNRLKGDKKSFPQLKDLIRKMNQHQRNKQYRAADKFRRQLNTFFLGKIGLRDGKAHLIGIINQYQSLKDGTPDCETNEFREILRQHFLYLFTAYDHENYEALLSDYEECAQNNEWPIPLKALFNMKNMIQMADGNFRTRRSNDGSTSKECKVEETIDSSLFFSDNVGERSETSVIPDAGSETVPCESETHKNDESMHAESANDQKPQESVPQSSSQCQNVPELKQEVVRPKTPEKTQKITVTNSSPAKSQPKPDPVNFSEESLKIISEAMGMFTLMNNQKAISKLKMVEQKANKNQITQEDYQSLLHIQNIVQSKIASTSSSAKDS